MKYSLGLILLFTALISQATTHQVGTNQIHISPYALSQANVLQDGDTVLIDAETYTGNAAKAVWQRSDLVIKGIGGRPKLDADGISAWGVAIWVFAGNNTTVENIEFYGTVVPDNNGAGIRLGGIGMTVRHCFFHDNENGILTSNANAGDVLIEFSEFANNGYGDGFTHNIYVGRVNKLIFRFNYSHHAKIGHNLKSRANENYIYYNRIMDEESGTSSRLIDLPNGGFSIIKGNLLMQGEDAPNKNLIGYGLEGLSNTSNELYIVNNTIVNKRSASCLFLDINEESEIAQVSNNIFAGTGDVYTGTIAELNNNLNEPNIAELHFADEPNYDYRLKENSPAIEFGIELQPVNGHVLVPDTSYQHPIYFESRNTFNEVDAGAYEYSSPLSQTEGPSFDLLVYPNPVSEMLTIDLEAASIQQIQLIDMLGQIVFTDTFTNRLDLSALSDGAYFLKIKLMNETIFMGKVSKKAGD